MSRPESHVVDPALRADVRLLGDTLGRVLAEQEGDETFELEERIRGLARLGRGGDRGASAELAATVAALPVETQAVVLRAFTIYFHLANIAEQHHRVRRRREIEREGGTLRESLDEALGLLAAAGVGEDAIARAAADVSVELVLTAHPTEALPRTILEQHRRLEGLLDELDDPRLTPVERERLVDAARGGGDDPLADGRGALRPAPRRRRDPAGAVVRRGHAVGRGRRPARRLAQPAARRAAPVRHLDRRRPRREPERRAGDRARGGRAGGRARARPPAARRPRARRGVGHVAHAGRVRIPRWPTSTCRRSRTRRSRTGGG